MTLLDELREDAEQARKTAEKVLAIPGSRFAVRFVPPPREKLDTFLANYRNGALSENDELQMIVDCHDEILRRDGDGGGAPADPENGPWKFDGSDERWGADVDNAHQAVMKLYRHATQPFVVSNHVEALVLWLGGLDAEAGRRAVGKLNGAAV